MAKKRKIKPFTGKRQRKGIVLFVIILLVIVGFIAFKLVEAHDQKQKNKAFYEILVNDGKPSKYYNPTKINPKGVKISPLPVDQSYLVPQDLGNGMVGIPEIGIQFPLPEEINDLIYYQKVPNSVWFSRKSLIDVEPTACAASMAPMGYFGKIYKSDLTSDNPSGNWRTNESVLKRMTQEWVDESSGTIMSAQVKEFDEFYLLFEGPQAYCLFDTEYDDSGLVNIKPLKSIIPQIELL